MATPISEQVVEQPLRGTYQPTTFGRCAPKSWSNYFTFKVAIQRQIFPILFHPFFIKQAQSSIDTVSFPFPKSLNITPVTIPRRKDIELEGLSDADKEGENTGEWIKHVTPKDKVVFHIHGGGFVVGSASMMRPISCSMALQSDAEVLSVNYRLSPTHVFPCALHDVISSYLHLMESVDPKRVIVAGESAGGNLAISLLLYLRKNATKLGVGMPAGIVLISPWIDLTRSMPSSTLNYKYDHLPEMKVASLYVNDESLFSNPLVSPIFAQIDDSTDTDVTPLPPMLVHTGSLERLYHEDLYLVGKTLEKSSGPVTLEVFEDMVHVHQLFDQEFLTKVSFARISKFIVDTLNPEKPSETPYYRKYTFIRNKQLKTSGPLDDQVEEVPLRHPMEIIKNTKKILLGQSTEGLRLDSKKADGIDYALLMHGARTE